MQANLAPAPLGASFSSVGPSPDTFVSSSVVITSTGKALGRCYHWLPDGFQSRTLVVQTRIPLPPLDMTQVPDPPNLIVPQSTMSLKSDAGTTIELIEALGHGALWDVYLARSEELPAETFVVKVADLLKFPIRRNHRVSTPSDGEEDENEDEDEPEVEGEEDSKGYTRSEARRAIATEALIYSDSLKELQGKVVPAFYGVFGASQPPTVARKRSQLCCMILGDAGRHLPLSQKFDKVNQATILDMYRSLHASGVLHVDIEWRHIRAREGKLMLIDFERSVAKSAAPTEEEWQGACNDELNEVRMIITNINEYCEGQLETWGRLMG